MKIGKIMNRPYPEEIRLTKQADALIKAGHELFLLCPLRKNEPSSEIVNGISVQRIKTGFTVYTNTFWDTINAALWIHPVFARHIRRFIIENQIDILYVHDLPLTNTVLKAGRACGIKVVLDMHENYPAGLITWSIHKTNPLVRLKNRLFFNYKRWIKYEERMVQEVDLVIAVVKEMEERIKEKHKIKDDKIITITNDEPKNFIVKFSYYEELELPFKDKFKILYIGGFGPHRGLDTAIAGLPIILKKIPNAVLILVGDGTIKDYLKKLVTNYGVENHVHFIPTVPFRQVYTYMKMSDVNIIPHNRNEHTDNTIPHKLFQSMMTGKPVLVSDCMPLKRIMDETGGGFVFKADDSQSFAEMVIYIHCNPREAATKGKNAVFHTTHGDYNWDYTSEQFVRIFPSILY